MELDFPVFATTVITIGVPVNIAYAPNTGTCIGPLDEFWYISSIIPMSLGVTHITPLDGLLQDNLFLN